MNTNLIKRASEIIASRSIDGYIEGNNGYYSTLAQIGLDGYPTTTTISFLKTNGIHTLNFCTSLDSNAAKRAQNNNRGQLS